MPRPTPLRDTNATGRSDLDHRLRLGDQLLTPRTPHSRAGRAEEALHEIELDPVGDDEYRAYRQQQMQPLLPSSEGYRSRGDDYTNDGSSKWTRNGFTGSWPGKVMLVTGIGLCIVLLGMSVMSYKKPETLQYYMGIENTTTLVAPPLADEPSAAAASTSNTPVATFSSSPPNHSGHPVDSSELISYENYSVFPLTGEQYKHECNRIAGGFMSHGEYWSRPFHGPYDVLHADENQGENEQTDYHPFEGQKTKICARTLTYQLDGNVGLLADLALMSQAAALAEQVSSGCIINQIPLGLMHST
jgi:hypothetical protein